MSQFQQFAYYLQPTDCSTWPLKWPVVNRVSVIWWIVSGQWLKDDRVDVTFAWRRLCRVSWDARQDQCRLTVGDSTCSCDCYISYIRQVNGVKLANIPFLLLSVASRSQRVSLIVIPFCLSVCRSFRDLSPVFNTWRIYALSERLLVLIRCRLCVVFKDTFMLQHIHIIIRNLELKIVCMPYVVMAFSFL